MQSKGLIIFAVFLSALSSHGIIVRHDVAPGHYELRSSDFPAVFYLERQGIRRICGATLIHERWAITAAHCVDETTLGDTIESGRRFAVEVGNAMREIDAVLMHPAITNQQNPEIDLALLRFRNPSPIPRPINIFRESYEQGEIATLVGWGYFGLGTTGRQFDDGTKRRAQNRFSQADSKLRIIFDDPRIRGNDSLPLEGTLGLGDSGGPALIETEEGYQLAGVAIGEVSGDHYAEETQGIYGSVAVYERISLHINWILSVIGSES
ncbi:MAG: trypsin-like serine protease [Gammaproteobacteria bacterium]|nr:trypsin-like serine protease [Gammaproteobacteria bacterium]MDD9895044.1 trypsin-like serine protease [Gammaproteobacteria bacterium]MDD9957464.1 trypsin-like serine protease [Gammaproteobacteria bacterium]